LAKDHAIRLSKRPKSEADAESWLAEIPDLPGCSASGDTPAKAVDAVLAAKDFLIAAGLYDAIGPDRAAPVPQDSDIHRYSGQLHIRIPKALHHRLVMQALQQRVSLNQYATYLLTSASEGGHSAPQAVSNELPTV
jgi:antitoxin HicB